MLLRIYFLIVHQNTHYFLSLSSIQHNPKTSHLSNFAIQTTYVEGRLSVVAKVIGAPGMVPILHPKNSPKDSTYVKI